MSTSKSLHDGFYSSWILGTSLGDAHDMGSDDSLTDLQNPTHASTAIPLLIPRPYKCRKCQNYRAGNRSQDHRPSIRHRPDGLLSHVYLQVSNSRCPVWHELELTTKSTSELPSNLVLKKASPKLWLPFLTALWGIITMCLGFVKNYAGFVAVRALLGIAEGGLLPGMV